jgi:peptidoglycan/xylan/chitin deacetylase (PgdA/CDA1 family)
VRVRDGRLADRVLSWAYDRGVTNRITSLRRAALTVVCYHRIGDPASSRFHGFTPNISASSENFERHIDYLCKHFTPIRASDLSGFFNRPERLPRRPALVTFDDGYKDNAELAWPILRSRGVPAIVFLATDHIGANHPFLWDFAAYCFHRTGCVFADVPLLGRTSLRSQADRNSATENWVMRSKTLPAAERWSAADAMRRSLAVVVPNAAFSGLYLSWDDVRRLASEGLEFGGHTRTHPILTTMPLDEAREEITASHERISAELGRPPVAFAYPNGSRMDFTRDHETAVRQSGYSIAFSLEPGPIALAKARQRPMAIRRIYVGFKDDMPRFAAKLAGAWQLGAFLRHRSAQPVRHDGVAGSY